MTPTPLVFLIGVMLGVGVYLLLRRSLVQMVLGLGLLSNAANLLILSAAGILRGAPPLIAPDEKVLGATADPLPQALILTAIVITFGVQAFALVLFLKLSASKGTEDVHRMDRSDDPTEEVHP